jgi:hypothetical protein
MILRMGQRGRLQMFNVNVKWENPAAQSTTTMDCVFE